jgi:bisphosphoglycerate-dependent phosphoglycerate mutase
MTPRADDIAALTYTEQGEMEPTLPPAVAKALQQLRSMTTPYFTGDIADAAEHQLRVVILAHVATLTAELDAAEQRAERAERTDLMVLA